MGKAGFSIEGTILNPSFIAKSSLKRELRKVGYHLVGRLLDVGCGLKPYRGMFPAETYVGIDRPATESKSCVVDVYASATQLPFKDGVFDSVLCTQVLEHVSEPCVLLKEACRVLKVGGYMILTAPQTWGVHEAPYDYYRYTSYGLEYLSLSAGFEIVSISPTCGVWAMAGQRISGILFSHYGKGRNIFLKCSMILFCSLIQAVSLFLDWIFGGKGDTLDNVLVVRKK